MPVGCLLQSTCLTISCLGLGLAYAWFLFLYFHGSSLAFCQFLVSVLMHFSSHVTSCLSFYEILVCQTCFGLGLAYTGKLVLVSFPPRCNILPRVLLLVMDVVLRSLQSPAFEPLWGLELASPNCKDLVLLVSGYGETGI